MSQLSIGDRVKALRRVTESGTGDGRPEAKYPDGDYIHAEPGDTGIVEYVEDGTPTVRFGRTGTATAVNPSEIGPVA